MTEKSRPWNGIVTGDAGPYTDANWQELYRAIIGFGAGRSNNGVFLMSGTEPNDGLKVQAQAGPTSSVDVLAGAALIQGIAYMSTATVAFAIAANGSGNPRIDTVIVRADYALQTCRLAVLQGTPAASPVAPTLTQSAGVMWEIPLADIAVANGFSSIANSVITPRHEWVNAPPAVYVDSVLNNSGATLSYGQVVVWDSTADRAVTTTTTRDAKKVAGVWQGITAAGGKGRVLRVGIGYVKSDAAVTRGDLLMTGTTAGSASHTATSEAVANGLIGRALETTSGAGYVLAMVNAHTIGDVDFVLVQDQKSSGTTGGTGTATAWTTHILNTEVVDTGNIASVASNQITLPPGIYSAYWSMSSGANIGASRTRLRDTTGGVTLAQGIGALNNSGLTGYARFQLTVSSAIELQYWLTTSGANALGIAVSTGDVEVYASVFITRHGESPS